MLARMTFRGRVALAARRAKECHRGEGERGSAILETALSAIILLCFIFGIMEVALAAYSYHFISEAAREGARYAIVRGSTAGTGAACASYSSSYCNASADNITSYIQNINFPGIDPAKMTVTSTWASYASGSTCPASPSPCNSPGNQVNVTVQYNFPLSIPFVPSSTIAMSSTAAMIISQ